MIVLLFIIISLLKLSTFRHEIKVFAKIYSVIFYLHNFIIASPTLLYILFLFSLYKLSEQIAV